MESFHQSRGMSDAIEEIGIAKRNVLCARSHLLSNIGHHYIATNNSKHTVVHRNNGAVPAPVFATSTGFGRSHQAISSTGHHQVGVLLDRWHARTIGHFKSQAFERNQFFRSTNRHSIAENGGDAQPAQILGIHRGV